MSGFSIRENVRKILAALPEGVKLLAAAKTRTAPEIQQAIDAGVKIVGHNYVQEAKKTKPLVSSEAAWHFIGHLQRNKVRHALQIFDLIESLDSISLAEEINKRCVRAGRVMPCLVEINSGREKNKCGVMPEDAEAFVSEVAGSFPGIEIQGLMTMGPLEGSPEDFSPYFKITRQLFETLKARQNGNFSMRWLSMGMTASYKTAIEEGANIVRIGTAIFGSRPA